MFHLRFRRPAWATIALIFSVCTFVGTVFGEETKIGYINSEQLLASHTPHAEAMAKFNEFRANWEKEALDKRADLERLMGELERQQLILTEQRRKKMEQDIEAKATEYEKFVDDAVRVPDGKLARKQEELLKPIYDRINEVLQQIGEEEGYDFIFDAVSGLAFAKPDYDLTERVLEELKEEEE